MNQEQLQENAKAIKGKEVKVDLTNGDQLKGEDDVFINPAFILTAK